MKLHPPPTRTLRALSRWLSDQTNITDSHGRAVRVSEQSWTSSTDQNVAGSRLRIPGKGRRGIRFEVRLAKTPPVSGDWFTDRTRGLLFQHDSGETYRRHEEAVSWVIENLRRRVS